MLALAAALGVTCEAFSKPAENAEPRAPGRPAKVKDEPGEVEEKPRRKGRGK